MKVKTYFNNLNLMAFLGFIFVCLLFYFRFLRERLPKDIPYVLSDKSFILLFLTCVLLLVSLSVSLLSKINLIKNKGFFLQEWIKTCLCEFDYKFKSNLGAQLTKKLEDFYIKVLIYGEKSLLKSKYIYFSLMFPKILLPLILYFDVFYLHNIGRFYLCLFLLIIPLLYRYLYHSLHSYYIKLLDVINDSLYVFIEEKNDHTIITKRITNNGAHFYIQEKVLEQLKIRFNKHEFSFELSEIIRKNKTQEQQEMFFNNFWKNNFPLAHRFYKLLYIYKAHENRFEFFINFFMLLAYAFCWCYVLLMADYSSISIEFLTFLDIFKVKSEPFSDLRL